MAEKSVARKSVAKFSQPITQLYQTKLRKLKKDSPEALAQLQKLEIFSSENDVKVATDTARSQGYLRFTWHPEGREYSETVSTRLKGESPMEHLDLMIKTAIEMVGPKEVGLGGLGGEEPMMEESKKFSRDEVGRLIIEEWADVYLKDKLMKIDKKTLKELVLKEISKIPGSKTIQEQQYQGACPIGHMINPKAHEEGQPECIPEPEHGVTNAERRKARALKRKRRMARLKRQGKYHPDRTGTAKGGGRIRRPRGWYKKRQYPHKEFPRYSVGDDGKPGGKDDIASFKKFYAACRTNRTCRRRLGRRDYHWGNKHSDAYQELNPESRARGRTKVSAKAAASRATGSKATVDRVFAGQMKMYKYDDDVAQATAEYERISRKIEGMMRHLDTWRAEIKRISALDPMPQEEHTKMTKYQASLKKHEPSRKTWARVVARKKQEVLDAVARAKAKGPPKKVPKAEKPGSPEFVQQLGKSV